jgi:hypothetical protein
VAAGEAGDEATAGSEDEGSGWGDGVGVIEDEEQEPAENEAATIEVEQSSGEDDGLPRA